jgi:hypothetical protein
MQLNGERLLVGRPIPKQKTGAATSAGPTHKHKTTLSVADSVPLRRSDLRAISFTTGTGEHAPPQNRA